MPLVEYVEKNPKEIKGSPKHPLIYLSIHFIIYFSYTNFGLYTLIETNLLTRLQ
jgi:hypothetical protein